jgi:hypothetical protein
MGDIVTKTVSNLTQRQLQHASASVPPQLTRLLVVRSKGWIAK